MADEYAESQKLEDIGMMEALRILKQCRQATANIPRPTRKSEVDGYISQCAPIVEGIVAQAMKDSLPE